jgi:hypothetical protein
MAHMAGRAFHVPDEMADAIRLEAVRQTRRPGDVLVDFLRTYWPAFVEQRLRSDFEHPAARRVINADSRSTEREARALTP